MARMVSRRPTQEKKGIGDFISESIIWIIVIAALLFAGRWYFFVYRASPGFALQGFITAIKNGDYKSQYSSLTADSQSKYGSAGSYGDKARIAHGLAARIQNFSI